MTWTDCRDGPGAGPFFELLRSRDYQWFVPRHVRKVNKILLVVLIACCSRRRRWPSWGHVDQLGRRPVARPTTNRSRSPPTRWTTTRTKPLVTATGHVEAWQNGHVMRADKITFDRNTGVAAATGHVVLLEPDGEVMFADYAEMQNNMNDGILKDMRALLQQNGKLAANGAQRTGGEINELSKVVYTTCNLCAKDPTRPPLWQIRAVSAVQDLEHKKIEYHDATLEMYGIPVAYFPYFWHADPSVKRESGILPPVIGSVVEHRRVLRPALLPGDRRPVRRDVPADDHAPRQDRSSISNTAGGSTTARSC